MTEHRRAGTNTLVHLVLVFLTGGMWLLPWLVLVVMSRFRQAYCCNCHTPYRRGHTPCRRVGLEEAGVREMATSLKQAAGRLDG